MLLWSSKVNFYAIGDFLPKLGKMAKIAKFSFWKSPISWPQISFRLLPTSSKWSLRCSGKSGDSFRYLQSSFWMARSCCETQKWILMKLVDFDQNMCKKRVFCSKVWLIKPPENFLLVLETCSGYLKGVPRSGECSAFRFNIVRHIHRTLSGKTSPTPYLPR